MLRGSYQGNGSAEIENRDPATRVTLKSEKQGDNMAEKQKYYVEVFVQDFHGKRTSLGKHETHVENWTLYVAMTPMLALSEIVRSIHLEFSGKVPEPDLP